MLPERLRYLQRLLAYHAKDWDFDLNPVFHAPVYLSGSEPSYIPDQGVVDMEPAELRRVTFTQRRGIITYGDILRPKPGRWIEAEGHIIEATVHEDGKWHPCSAIEGNRVGVS